LTRREQPLLLLDTHDEQRGCRPALLFTQKLKRYVDSHLQCHFLNPGVVRMSDMTPK
jgi:hypothetical protein